MMDLPFIKRVAAKYQAAYTANRKKSVEEYRREQYDAYQAKGKGVCDLHRHLRKEPAMPLVAVRRKQKGSANQRPGTIATSPKEIDEIIRLEYGKIYKGNNPTNDTPQAFVRKYVKRYSDFIFKHKELTIHSIIGEDVAAVVRGLKATAGGLDQWGPADLKLLSDAACDSLATLFNMIESGCSWPHQHGPSGLPS